MSSSLNLCQFIGNLGRDPEVRALKDGSKVVNLSLAVSESWKDKSSGERKERTEWVRVVIWDEMLADIAEKYLRKGSKVYLSGSLITRKWTDQQVDKYSTEVVLRRFSSKLVLLDSRESDAESGRPQPASGAGGGELDDAIPFAPCM